MGRYRWRRELKGADPGQLQRAPEAKLNAEVRIRDAADVRLDGVNGLLLTPTGAAQVVRVLRHSIIRELQEANR